MTSLKDLYDSTAVDAQVQSVNTFHLARELGSQYESEQLNTALDSLRVAAVLSLDELLNDAQVDSLLRKLAAEDSALPVPSEYSEPFRKWTAYVTALDDHQQLPTCDELLLYSAAGLVARQPTEVRSFLRQSIARRSVRDFVDGLEQLPWPERVRGDITIALLYLVRQESHEDLSRAAVVIRRLAQNQKSLEATWLGADPHSRRTATTLLGLYHLAQAVIYLSEFLLVGAIDKEKDTDFGAELRRLIVRAEEYLLLSADVDLSLWLGAAALVMWRLRSDSIWVTGRGISERLDQLLTELSRAGRDRPVFSLLPSQQDALRQSLLDPSRVAVVLQMPTSAGKTLLAEFAIVQVFEAYKAAARVVYVVPTRALATQVRRTLAQDLRPLGIEVSAAGSAFEEDPYELELLLKSDGIVVATPEKLDLLLRTHPEWFDSLRLVVVDEAHLLGDSERGVRLELLLANIRREHAKARLLLLTPFVDNAKQIASWLGGARGLPISVYWRPSRLLLGLATTSSDDTKLQSITVEWSDPLKFGGSPSPIVLRTTLKKKDLNTSSKRVTYLAERFLSLGSVLALFSASPKQAEDGAEAIAKYREQLPPEKVTPSLRVAIALAKDEYGQDSILAKALERGVAFHHSSLSPMLRYLIEDQVRSGSVNFIAATTTLAQGMNFPVAAVVVHSVHKPYGAKLSPSEFWNIAGRAGRVGLIDKGLVVFASEDHRHHYNHYTEQLTEGIRSALLDNLQAISRGSSLKDEYREHEELRPFIQYLAHAAATESPAKALQRLEELLQGSLANAQVRNDADSQALRSVARRYLETISGAQAGYLKAADSTGLASFSFDELFAKIGDDPVLRAGPAEVLAQGQDGIEHLIEALKWLPELNLALGLGSGEMNVEAVARVVQAWIEGQTVPEIASEFAGATFSDRVRKAAKYVFGEVSQTISWGAHAYLRGWLMRQRGAAEVSPQASMLGSYIQYGVKTPEAAVASLLGVPRQFAESFAQEYRDEFGNLKPEAAEQFKAFVEGADEARWERVTMRSNLGEKLESDDVRHVWRLMQGLEG